MKKYILFLLLFAAITAANAQNPRIETLKDYRLETYNFTKGGDSVRFKIVGTNDTIQKNEHYRNGNIKTITWKKDSSYRYDGLGRLTEKIYKLDNKNENGEDETHFFANGQIAFIQTTNNKDIIQKTFNKDGRLILLEQIKHTPNYTYKSVYDRNNMPIKGTKTDTVLRNNKRHTINYDTIFYDNKQPFRIKIDDSEKGNFVLNWYNEDGSLIKSLFPDSLKLIIFKDNVDCYYGLKNKRGDTIVKPRFDRIEILGDDFIAAYTNASIILLQPNGAPLSTKFTYLTGIQKLDNGNKYSYYTLKTYKSYDDAKRYKEIRKPINNYLFVDNGKYGIMTDKGEILLPPQYFKLGDEDFNNADFFRYFDIKGDSLIQIGYINRNGENIFPDYIKGAYHTYFDNYFFLSSIAFMKNRAFEEPAGGRSDKLIDVSYLNEFPYKNILGLGKRDGTILLAPKFNRLQHIGADFFTVSVIKRQDTNKKNIYRTGIYNARINKMILDTTDFILVDEYSYILPYFVVQQVSVQKYGLIDTTGKYVLPFIYDTISIVDREKGLFWTKKGKDYQIVCIKKGKIKIYKTIYDFLYPIEFRIPNNYEQRHYFIAQHENKWGVIDIDNKIVKPFDNDYALITNNYWDKLYLVKNNQLSAYDNESWPNETPLYTDDQNVRTYRLVGDFRKIAFINNTGKVVIPPQYKEIYQQKETDFKLVEDSLGNKKLVFLKTGRIVDYPFNYKIEIAVLESRIIVVKDKKEFSYGVVSTNGKELIPCNNYNIALADVGTSTFFVKNDTPIVNRLVNIYGRAQTERINSDKLMIEDANWFMYDSLGKKIDNQPFRFPIKFNAGIGIGKQDKGFNLYNTNGKIIEPFVKNIFKNSQNTEGVDSLKNKKQKYQEGFNNIFSYKNTGFYAFFYNQGITPTLILTKKDGEIIINSGRYDGISTFYGQYALVSDKDKVGLVDSFGREIIAPQDLWTSNNHFMDSLDILNIIPRAENRKKALYYSDDVQQPISFDYGNRKWHPDSLNIKKEQIAALWNLLLEKKRTKFIQTANDMYIQRVPLMANTQFLNVFSDFEKHRYTYPKRIAVAENTIAFIVRDNDDSYYVGSYFYSFHYKNNRWEELKINDVLQIQGDNRWLLNDLITKKVKALKDQEIDCSNTSAFVTAVENRFMLTKEGIDFLFDATKDRGKFVTISFTWAELKPFLKLKIGNQ
jgi:hypothetical protein